MFVFAVESMAVSLLGGDGQDSSAFAMDNLAGKAKGDPGLMQAAVVKQKLIAWFLEIFSSKITAASGAGQSVTSEGYRMIRGASASPLSFVRSLRERAAPHN